jgi:hypothetical protein
MKREKVMRKQGQRLHWRTLPSFIDVFCSVFPKYSARLAETVTNHNAIMLWLENVK